MKKFIISMVSSVLLLFSVNVSAYMLDFIELADVDWGESAWTQMVFSDLDGSGIDLVITAYNGQDSAYAYLDANTAGLGVCSTGLAAGKTADVETNSGANVCGDASDDNLTASEFLVFSFFDGDDPFAINGFTITVNDNHKDGSVNGQQLLMNGAVWNTSGATDTYTGFGQSSSFTVANSIGQFYIQSIEVERGGFILRVPEPSNLVLMALAIIGLVISRKKLA